MHVFEKYHFLVLACGLFLASFFPLNAQEPRTVTIELSQGARISGQLIYERGDHLYLDLGFRVIEIPRESVLSVNSLDQAVSESAPSGELYRSGSQAQPRSVREWVEVLGEAVVLVRTPTGLGSGFIIHEDGYVVTNDHVIAGEHEISITVYEEEGGNLKKSTYENVRIVAASAEQDLALLRIDDANAPAFQSVPIGESGDIRAGQKVFAIGSPLGLERTVSEGIVSLGNRLIDGRLYIQQTAEISPGNSGGPLFNLKGEVVGVNNMKVVVSGAEGLGFAIPSNVLKVFLHNRDAFAFDPLNPNAGFRYNPPPTAPAHD